MKLRIYNAFPTKKVANSTALGLRLEGVQFVRVRPIKQGRLKYGVYIGGRGSTKW